MSIISRGKFERERQAYAAYGKLLDDMAEVERLFALAGLPLPELLAEVMCPPGGAPPSPAGTETKPLEADAGKERAG